MEHIFTLNECRAWAKRLTIKASEIKDWRLTRKADREMKALAVELAKGKGYICATPAELERMHPTHYKNLGGEERKIIWAIHYNTIFKCMQFRPIR